MDYTLVADLDVSAEPQDILFLEPHDELPRQWAVDSFDIAYLARMEGTISKFDAVSVFDLPAFYDKAQEQGYRLAFFDDPAPILSWVSGLNVDPGIELDLPPLPSAHSGLLPFQIQAINFMKHCERCVYFVHDTGMGKTVVSEATILYKLEQGFDLVLWVMQPNNLVNTQRKLQLHTGLESTIVQGTPKKRAELYGEANGGSVLIFNAEKFNEDKDALIDLITDRRVVVLFDEMPEKYSNRQNQLYRNTCEVLYTSFAKSTYGKSRGKKVYYPKAGKERAAEMFFVATSATPVINSPQDFFNQIRMMDSRIYGSISSFNSRFIKYRDPWGNPAGWRDLDYMGALAAHVVHYADKNDPAVKDQFPEKLPPEYYNCGLADDVWDLYGLLQDEYRKLLRQAGSMLTWRELLAAISVFQLLCCNPRSVLKSSHQYAAYLALREAYEIDLRSDGFTGSALAKELKVCDEKFRQGSEVAWKFTQLVDDDSRFTDRDRKGQCTVPKLVALKEYLDAHDGKAIVFSTLNELLLPLIEEWFEEWGISYVTYHGELSGKQGQEIQDSFRQDPDIKVFLSSEAGKTSIDLPEASLTIHYDLPYTDATKIQRENRQDRIDSLQESVQVVTLICPNTVEDRKLEIIEDKAKLYAQMRGEIVEQTKKLSRDDLVYILLGEQD